MLLKLFKTLFLVSVASLFLSSAAFALTPQDECNTAASQGHACRVCSECAVITINVTVICKKCDDYQCSMVDCLTCSDQECVGGGE